MTTNKIFLGVLAGFAAGTLTGVLFAPAKGSKTRQKIMDMGEDCVQHLKSTVNEHVESLSNKYSHLLGQAESVIQKGKSKLEEQKKDVEKSAADLKRI